MIKRIIIIGLIVFTTPAWSFEVLRSITEARILPPSPNTPVIQLDFRARLSRDIANPAGADVVVTWQKFGGIQPQPFIISIPVGCFVANRGLHVEDFRTCGVRMTVDLGRGPIALLISEFDASFLRRRDGTVRFVMKVGVQPPDDTAPAILGALGGAAVEIVIGEGAGISLPGAIETVGGVAPQPF